MLEGDAIGAVSSPSVVWDWLEQKKAAVQRQYPDVQSGVTIGEINLEYHQPIDGLFNDQSVKDELDKRSTVYKRGVQIRIEGKPLGFVKDEAAAVALLEQYKQSKVVSLASQAIETVTATGVGTVASKGAVRILSGDQAMDPVWTQPVLLHDVQFVQNIELATIDIGPDEVSDNETLLNKLAAGEGSPIRYTVLPGDCISCIAHKFKIDKNIIYNNNPQIKNNLIRIGEELDLTVLQPLLSIKTIEQRTTTADFPFSTEYIEDDSLMMGVQEAISVGVPGLKQITIHTTRIDGIFTEEEQVDEAVVRPAIQAVVKKGTKVVPGIGTGQFAWPVYRAKLTSEYGNRWGAFHPGMDLVSEESSIAASDHGTVSYASWKTGYGNCVIIDHHNGYSTLYGHLSKISVDVDERIQKGNKIGIMGSTGNATGVHLHFEIRKGEKQENPMHYLGKAS
jgi:murein DD-endopeptidase MepM/ murein hydrolase activator NlpD